MKSLCMKVIVTSLVLGQSFLIKTINANETFLKLSDLSLPVIVESGAYDNDMCVLFDLSGQQWNTTLGAVRKYVARNIKQAEESGYKHAKNAFEKQIQNLEQNLDEVTKKLKNSQEFLKDQNGKHQKQIEALKADKETISKQLVKVKEDYQKLHKNFIDKQRDLNASNQYLEELRVKYAELQKGTSDLISTLQNSLAQTVDRVGALEQEINALRLQNEALLADNNQAREAIVVCQSTIAAKQSDLDAGYAKIAQLQSDYNALQSDQTQIQADYQAACDVVAAREATIGSQQKTLDTFDSQLGKARSDYQTLQSHYVALQAQHSACQTELEELNSAYVIIDTALTEIESLYQTALEQYESSYNQLMDYMHRLALEEAKNNELTARIAALTNDLHAVTNAYEKLLAHHASVHPQEVIVS